MTSLVLLLTLNAGMLLGFVLHSFLDGAHREDAAREQVALSSASSFRDDLLMPMLPAKNRYMH